MNISKAARTALIPIENTIKNQPVEYGVGISNSGKFLGSVVGNASSIGVGTPGFLFNKDCTIFTHNHPGGSLFYQLLIFVPL